MAYCLPILMSVSMRVPVAQALAGRAHLAVADIVDIVLALVVGLLGRGCRRRGCRALSAGAGRICVALAGSVWVWSGGLTGDWAERLRLRCCPAPAGRARLALSRITIAAARARDFMGNSSAER